MLFNTKGFTLIELMVVVAIIGILAAIAIPSYQDSVYKSRRADIKGVLTNFANGMERYYTEKSTYKGAATGGADTGTPAATVLPNGSDYYDLTITNATDADYTLAATPKGAQATDKCGVMSLTSTGVKDAKKNNVSVASCW